MLRQRQPRIKDDAHLKFVRTLQCVVCGDNTSVEAAHVSYAEPGSGKWHEKSIGGKASDRWVVPLCSECHRAQHDHGDEFGWWHHMMGIDPVKVAMALIIWTGDHAAGTQICEANKVAA